jgi:hypothetical protein
MLPRIALLLIFPTAIAVASPFSSPDVHTNCPTPSTVGYYSSMAVTCETGNVDSWLMFSGFTNTPSADDFIVQALANNANQGFYYPENLNGPLSFGLGFNVQAFNEVANSVTFHVTATSPPQGDSTVTMYVCAVASAACATSYLSSVTLGSKTTPIVTLDFTPTDSFGLWFVGSTDALSSLTQFETTVGTGTGGGGGGPLGGVPEPATPVLVGTGLLAVALVRRRAHSRKI